MIAYFLPVNYLQNDEALAAPVKLLSPNCFQPPIFSGVPYLNLTLSPSIH